MKKHIKIEDLKKDTRFSEDVYFECGHCLLLSAGNPLGERELRALRQWKIPFVVTEGEILKGDEEIDLEALESLEEDISELEKTSNTVYIEGLQLSNENIEIVSRMGVFDLPKELKDSNLYSEYVKIAEELCEIFDAIREGKKLTEKVFSFYASEIQKMANEHPQETIMFVLAGNVRDYAFEVLNTALVIALICPLMNIDEVVSIDIIVAGLLHNVGILRFPTPLKDENGELTETEIQILKTRILHAYKCAVEELSYSENIGNSILQQYERWDGKGYPEGLSGTNIDFGARLISITSGFVKALSRKTQGKPSLGYEAIKTLLSDGSLKFDPNIVNIVVQCMGIYPIGSVVLLNDGAICKVIQFATNAPLRPRVQVILSETGKIANEDQKQIIDLKEDKEKFIVRAVDLRMYLK